MDWSCVQESFIYFPTEIILILEKIKTSKEQSEDIFSNENLVVRNLLKIFIAMWCLSF